MDSEPQFAKKTPSTAPRRWLRFRMRTLLVFVTIIGVWLGWHVNRAERQRRAVDAIRGLGGGVRYSFDLDPDSESAVSRRLREVFGDHFFGRATYVFLSPEAVRAGATAHLADLPWLGDLTIQVATDDDVHRHLPDVARLRRLRYLNLESTRLGDEGLAQLAGLTTLAHLDIGYNLPITDEGLPHLYRLTRLKQLRAFRTSASDRAMARAGGGVAGMQGLVVNSCQRSAFSRQLADSCENGNRVVATLQGRSEVPSTEY